MIKIIETNTENPVEYDSWQFPGGEIGVKIKNPEQIKPDSRVLILTTGILDSNEIMKLCHLVDAVYAIKGTNKETSLHMPYFPYARQDRLCHPGENFALKLFVEMLSSIADKVQGLYITDPHSNVTVELLSKYFDVYVRPQHFGVIIECPNDYDNIISPDKGAAEKAKLYDPEKPHFYLTKTRVGKNVQYDDYAYDTIRGTAIVVDDICDGGATFIAIGEMLRRTQPNITRLDLYVTHGIFSKGTRILYDVYDHVYCINKMNNVITDRG